MIFLITGAIGTGKSLFTIDMVLERTGVKLSHKKPFGWKNKLKKIESFEQERPVFYFHIDELDESTTGWKKMDHPHNWNDKEKYPKGSLFVIDESHNYFAKNPKELPEYIKLLSESRHDAFDFYFITQDSMQVHHHLRASVNTHIHFERQEGYEANTRYKWNKLGNYKDYHSKSEAQKKRQFFKTVNYVYPLYKSSERHTSIKTVPFWFKVAPVALIFIVFMGYRIISRFASEELASETIDLSQIGSSNVLPSSGQLPNPSGSVRQRYSLKYLNKKFIQKNFYPEDIVGAISIYKNYVSSDFPYYYFKSESQTTRYTKEELVNDYAIDIDNFSRCRDALYFPELETVYYTTCEPKISHSNALQASSSTNTGRTQRNSATNRNNSNNTTNNLNPFSKLVN